MPRLLQFLVALIFLASASVKACHGVPEYKVGGDLYASFVHNEAWKHYAFLAVEFGLALWLLTGWKRKFSALTALFLLTTLTTLLLAEFFLSGAPRVCGCFANLIAERREEAKHALLWSTARNLVLIGMLAFALWKMPSPKSPAPGDSEGSPTPEPATA